MLYSSSTCNKRNSNQSIQMKWSNLHTYKFHYTRMQLSLREKNGNCEKLCNLKLKITNAIRIVFEFYLNEQRSYHGCVRSPPHLLCIRFASAPSFERYFLENFFLLQIGLISSLKCKWVFEDFQANQTVCIQKCSGYLGAFKLILNWKHRQKNLRLIHK